MPENWLGQKTSELYPLSLNSPRFSATRKHWGDEVDREKSGVYFLIALDPDNDGEERRVIPRFLGRDATGTLYIGKADRNLDKKTWGLSARMGDLCNSILPEHKGKSHFNGKLRDLYADKLPASCLALCWIYLSDEYRFAAEFEEVVMQRYIRRFGEAPPFNSQGFLNAIPGLASESLFTPETD